MELQQEVALLQRDYHSLLQRHSNLEEETKELKGYCSALEKEVAFRSSANYHGGAPNPTTTLALVQEAQVSVGFHEVSCILLQIVSSLTLRTWPESNVYPRTRIGSTHVCRVSESMIFSTT
mmetsp:Transcript_72774/g.118072  ORF Transcript_72774/g.118072 Transcript_72774/m.118072 type:complete len:121 (+) Transcript_72774:330-692(+)